jgi:hypothetical protein
MRHRTSDAVERREHTGVIEIIRDRLQRRLVAG